MLEGGTPETVLPAQPLTIVAASASVTLGLPTVVEMV
jgi:hypothetical protein